MPGTQHLVSLGLWRVCLPFRRPITAAHGTETVRDVVLVEATLGDGSVGWGECSALSRPTYTSEWTAGAWSILASELAPAALADRPLALVGHPMASAAVETAVLDARLRSDGINLAAALGGVPGLNLASTAVTGRMATTDDLVEAVAADLVSGYRSFKCKIAPGHDTEPLSALRATWPDLVLAADANGSYRRADLDLLQVLDRFDLTYVEQPLPADDLVGSARVASRLATPVALDESIRSHAAAEVAVALGAAKVLSVKPSRMGGMAEATATIGWAAEQGIEMFVGGMLETGVGRAAVLAVASLPALTMPTDLGPSERYFGSDVTDTFDLAADGTLMVPDGNGIGVTPHPDRLKETVRDHLVVRA